MKFFLLSLATLLFSCNKIEQELCNSFLVHPHLRISPLEKRYYMGDSILISWSLSQDYIDSLAGSRMAFSAESVTSFLGVTKFSPPPQISTNAINEFTIIPRLGKSNITSFQNNPLTNQLRFETQLENNIHIFEFVMVPNTTGIYGLGTASGFFRLNNRCRGYFSPVFRGEPNNAYLRDSVTGLTNWSAANQSDYYFIVQ